MSGNSTGLNFRLTTAGESHGEALVGVIDGCPAGFSLDFGALDKVMLRRSPGQNRFVSGRREKDAVTIVSGVFQGKTTGAPIAFYIKNSDAKSKDYESIKDVFRPGHADFTYHHKFGHRDYRGGGRASARETALWVAAGEMARQLLHALCGIKIQGYVASIGHIAAANVDLSTVEHNPFFFPDKFKIKALEALLIETRRAGDSIGARVNAVVKNVPIGLGEPVFDKLDADIAKAMMSIPAAKGVEIGDGFAVVHQKGSEGRDAFSDAGFISNHAGGVLGGISTGQDLIVSVAFKPTSSITHPIQAKRLTGELFELSVKGRHDPCVGIRAVPVVEARLALVLIDHLMRHNSRVLSGTVES